jgi:hypothetical protein
MKKIKNLLKLILGIVAIVSSVTFAATSVVNWQFEGNFTDSSGNGNDGTASGNPEFGLGMSGVGQSVILDGVDDEIVKTGAINLPTNPAAPWSINMYLWPSAPIIDWTPIGGFGKPDVAGADPTGERYLIRFASQMYFWTSGADVLGVQPFDIGEWQMVTMTFTGAPDNILKIYKNGVETNSGTISNLNTVQSTVAVGWSFLARYAGKMDNFSIWNGALTSSEISALVPSYFAHPVPSHLSTGVSIDQVLSWASASAVYNKPTYDLYFGTDPVGRNNPKVGAGLSAPNYALADMAAETQYYWAFDIKENGTIVYRSETYKFTTQALVPATKILEWKFDGNADDTVGTNNGTAYGNPQYVSGLSGQAIDFQNDGDLVANVEASGLPTNAHDSWSINMFVKPNTVPQLWTVLGGFGYAGVPELGVGQERYMLDLNQIYFWGGVGQDVGTGVLMDSGIWQMLTATYDGAIVKVYKNGKLLGSGTPTLYDTVQEVGVAFQGALGTTWLGTMDEFTIWNRPLLKSQMQSMLSLLPYDPQPIPTDNRLNVAVEASLSWTPVIDGQYDKPSYDLYLGTNATVRNNPKVGTNLITPAYKAAGLQNGTKYYWAMDVKNNGTVVRQGPTWTFTTVGTTPAVKIMEWKLDEQNGTVAYDTVGDNDGTLVDEPSRVSGLIGNCLRFNGTPDAVENESATNLPTDPAAAWSINMYLYVNAEIPDFTLLGGFGRSDNPVEGVGRYLVKYDGGVVFWDGFWVLSDPIAIDVGKWQMFTVTFDGAPNNMIYLYKDGVLVTSYEQNHLVSASNEVRLSTNTQPSTWPASSGFNGKIDQFTIWDGFLKQSQINQLADNLPRYQGDIDGDGLVNFADFDMLAGSWLTNNNSVDLSHDTFVNFEDLAVLAENWLMNK